MDAVFAVLYELCCVSVYVVGTVCCIVNIVLWVLWAVLCDLFCVVLYVLYCDYIKIFPIYQLSDMTGSKQCHHNLELVKEDSKGKEADTAHTGIRQH